MPSFNRRGFLQFLSAAGVAPFLPSMPVRAAAATAGASTSKALWAGIYAKSGSAAKFAGAARNMGLSSAAIQGVGARSVGVRLVAAGASNAVSQAAGRTPRVNAIKHVRDKLRDFDQALGVDVSRSDELVSGSGLADTPKGVGVVKDQAVND